MVECYLTVEGEVGPRVVAAIHGGGAAQAAAMDDLRYSGHFPQAPLDVVHIP